MNSNINKSERILDDYLKGSLESESINRFRLFEPKESLNANDSKTKNDNKTWKELKTQSEKVKIQLPEYIPSGNVYLNLKNGFQAMQKWEGVVEKVASSSFTAKLTDLESQTTDEEVTISKDDISPEDISLIKENAIFYWSIGYLMKNGQRIKSSLIRFRRLPKIDSFDHVLDIANKYKNSIIWD